TADAVTVAVTDRDGRPLPFAWVRVERPGGHLELSTAADGTVVLFPGYDRLGESVQLTVRPPSGQGRSVVTAFRPSDLSERRIVPIRLDARAERPRELDLALVIDTTGSMGDELSYLQAELAAIVAWLN